MGTPPPSPYADYTFPGRHDGEQMLLVLRRHWFVLVGIGVFFSILLVLPLLIRLLMPATLLPYLQATVWRSVLALGLVVYYLFLWLFFFTTLVDYYLDVWVVTDERIVSIEQIVLFRHVIAELTVIRVQDVTSDMTGVFPTFLNYGNVYVQTAGERERFVLLQVPHPEEVKKVIIKAHEAAVRGLLTGDQQQVVQGEEAFGISRGSVEQV